jgi:hypothetical protein
MYHIKDNAKMKELIPTINEIVKYGLYPNLTTTDRHKLLEKDLIKIYSLYFQINYEFDNADFPNFDASQLPNIKQNLKSNFSDFGLYKTALDIDDIDNLNDNAIVEAIDDLADITFDLLEIKWRIESNSLNDGLWYFDLIFPSHTQQHILNLLNYLKQRK